MPAYTIRDAVGIDLEVLEAVAYDGARIELADGLRRAIDRGRAEMLSALDRGSRVYAVTTGTGYQSSLPVDVSGSSFQENMLLGRAVGSAPYLPAAEARALMTARLVSLLSSASGASASLCDVIVDRLNAGFTPAVPRRAAGTAGEVIALSHAFQTLMGVGRVMDAGGCTRPAAEALAELGVEPYVPREKEGIALLSGAPGAIALTLGRLRAARRLADATLIGAALSIAAIDGPHDAYDRVVAELAGDPHVGAVNDTLRGLLGPPDGERRVTQTPVSFRVVPQVHAHLHRTLDRLRCDLARSLRAVSDSPAFVDGRFVSTGIFHDLDLAAGLDHLAIALCHVGELATQRAHRLLDRRFTDTVDQLSPLPGFANGPVVVHKRMAGAVNELRRLAIPCSVGLLETSLGQEDAMTFVFESAERLRRSEELLGEICACEVLIARQAWWVRGTRPAHGLTSVVDAVEALVPPIDADRPYGDDVDALLTLVHRGLGTAHLEAVGGGG